MIDGALRKGAASNEICQAGCEQLLEVLTFRTDGCTANTMARLLTSPLSAVEQGARRCSVINFE